MYRWSFNKTFLKIDFQPTNCIDDYINCPSWAQAGECTKNIGYMKVNCRKSCNICSSQASSQTTNPQCTDANIYCSSWAQAGECTKNPGYMKVDCKKSCNTCPTSSTSTSQCQESSATDCAYWAGIGQCTSNPGFMNVNCKKACNLCCKYSLKIHNIPFVKRY